MKITITVQDDNEPDYTSYEVVCDEQSVNMNMQQFAVGLYNIRMHVDEAVSRKAQSLMDASDTKEELMLKIAAFKIKEVILVTIKPKSKIIQLNP